MITYTVNFFYIKNDELLALINTYCCTSDMFNLKNDDISRVESINWNNKLHSYFEQSIQMLS